MKTSNRVLVIAITIAVMIAMTSIADLLQPSHIAGLFKPTSIQAQSPRSSTTLRQMYQVGPLTLYCEGAPSYNAVYTIVNVVQGGTAIQVIPGGCK